MLGRGQSKPTHSGRIARSTMLFHIQNSCPLPVVPRPELASGSASPSIFCDQNLMCPWFRTGALRSPGHVRKLRAIAHSGNARVIVCRMVTTETQTWVRVNAKTMVDDCGNRLWAEELDMDRTGGVSLPLTPLQSRRPRRPQGALAKSLQ
jgi:hypothetical protein